MSDQEIIQFVQKVVTVIQSNRSQSEMKKALIDILEDADLISEKLTGKRIVRRGERTLLDVLVSQPLTRIPEKK